MNAPHNPFSWNSTTPDLCYGRDALLSELLSGLPGSPRQFFGIAGARRMGKTTLLRRVESELRAGVAQWRASGLFVIPIYVDGLVLPRPLTMSDVWAYVFQEIQQALATPTFRVEGVLDFRAFIDVLRHTLPALAERCRIIVMFDEFEPIVVCDWASAFLGQWRTLLSNTPGVSEYFTAVFAGAREMALLRRDVGSPLKDILEWRNLTALDYEAACQLMQEPLGREWPEAFLRKAFEETGGHPMLLQYLMQHVCLRPVEVSRASLEEAVSVFSSQRRWQFSEWWTRYCTPTAQRVYMRLREDGTVLSLRELSREFGMDETSDALEILQHVGLVVLEDDGFAVRYSGEMFRRWYRAYGTLSDSPMHDPELQARLMAVGSELADKYVSAWKIYQAELPNYSGAIGEMRDTLTLLLDKVASEEAVSAQASFKLEAGQHRPTRRQRVRFIARQQHGNEHSKEISSDLDLLETSCDQVAAMVTRAYRGASGLTHTVATREMAYRALKQWDGILAQLVLDQKP